RHRLALLVVTHPFVEGVADTMRDRADDLSFGDHRIDDLSGVMREYDARNLHGCRLDVDLDLGDGRAVAIGHRIDDDVFRRVQSGRQVAGKHEAWRSCHRPGDLAEPDLDAAGAFHQDLIAFDIQIGWIDLEQM